MMIRSFLVATLLAGAIGLVAAPQPSSPLMGAPCTAATTGPVTEPKTGRTFLLDYPCDLKAGEQVTFILSLHGGGSNNNWQRRYFPAYDYKDQRRLVIATPYSPTRSWSENDDVYLQNIVSAMIDTLGKNRIKAFWLAGHSQGGSTSVRLICTDFFKEKVDGFLSLSGGRVDHHPRGGGGRAGPAPLAAGEKPPPPRELPACDFSHIYETGEHELQMALSSTSPWADKYGCRPRVRQPDVVDTQPGQVHDGSRQDPGTKQWGLLPRPGTAQVWLYPGCRDGKVVADVVRLDKGHTEGLEPKVTDAILGLMLSARGGKMQQSR